MPRTNCLSMLLNDDIADCDTLAFRVEPAVPDPANPRLEPHVPWDSEAVVAHGTFGKDPIDGLWKGWHLSTPAGEERFEAFRRLTYCESEDGVNWTRPELDISPQPGYPKTNIIFDHDSGGASQFASVLIHPDAEPERRYEMFAMRVPGRPEGIGANFIPGIPRRPGEDRHPTAVYRYFSSDGIHWNAEEGPLLEVMTIGNRMIMPYTTPIGGADHSAYFKSEDGGYELIQKVGTTMHPGGAIPYDCFPMGRRVIGRRTSPDGSNWSPIEVIIEPDWRDAQDLQFMELAPLKVKGGHLGLLCCYNLREQTINWQFAGSADRRIWERPARRPTLDNTPLGDYGGGMLWPTHSFIEHEGRVYMYYGALEGIHGDIFSDQPSLHIFNGALCRASWELDRYWAAVSASGGVNVGTLTTHSLPAAGKQLLLNAATSTVGPGELAVELLDPDGNVIEGFSREDYVAWEGDSKAQPARWSGGSVAPRDDVAAKFYLRRSRLYGFAWE